ncbi:MAG: hypothetical protein IPK99_13425 [Flavobacteriales bacterium]|nr:hypothetical protein [Flavobacteriales bacterium]
MVSTKAKLGREENALFAHFTPGITTTGMDWCHSSDRKQLEKKVRQHIARIAELRMADAARSDGSSNSAPRGFDEERMIELLYRPFSKRYFYHDADLNEMLDRSAPFFGANGDSMNTCILLLTGGAGQPLTVCASNTITHQRFTGPGSAVHMVALHRIGMEGQRSENLTNWGLERFRSHYGPRPLRSLADGVDPKVPSTLTAIRAARAQGLKRLEPHPPAYSEIDAATVFHYVYAVLNDPSHPPERDPGSFIAPLIPLHSDLEAWSDRGRRLMELHTGFEMVEPWPLEVRTEHAGLARGATTRGSVLVDKEQGSIQLDRYTSVLGIPTEAWSYVLGERSALEWTLEAWKERSVGRQDPAAKGASRYMEHLDRSIQRIKRVCRVSMETHRIRREIAMLAR